MATDRPDGDDDTGWLFDPQSDTDAGLRYEGEASHQIGPGTPSGGATAQPPTPGTPLTPDRGPSPPDDPTGAATAPFTPSWAADPAPAASAQPASPTEPRRGSNPANGTQDRKPATAGGGTGQAIALGALVGVVALVLAWFFVFRSPSP